MIKIRKRYGPAANVDLTNVAKTNVSNAFNASNSQRIKNHGIKNNVNGSTVVIDVKETNFHTFTVAGPCDLIFNNWELATHVTPLMVTIVNPGSSSLNISGIKWVIPATGAEYDTLTQYLQAIGRNPATLSTTGRERFVFWSENGGTVKYGRFQ